MKKDSRSVKLSEAEKELKKLEKKSKERDICLNCENEGGCAYDFGKTCPHFDKIYKKSVNHLVPVEIADTITGEVFKFRSQTEAALYFGWRRSVFYEPLQTGRVFKKHYTIKAIDRE